MHFAKEYHECIVLKRRQSTPVIAKRKKIMKLIWQEDRGKELPRAYQKLGKRRSSSSLGVKTSLAMQLQAKGKGGWSRSLVRMKLRYKSIILKAKETLRIKMMENGFSNMIEKKRIKVQSLVATRRKAAETKEKYRLLKKRRNMLIDELNGGIDEFVRLRATETLLMMELGFL